MKLKIVTNTMSARGVCEDVIIQCNRTPCAGSCDDHEGRRSGQWAENRKERRSDRIRGERRERATHTAKRKRERGKREREKKTNEKRS
jgi:hypothetical protein